MIEERGKTGVEVGIPWNVCDTKSESLSSEKVSMNGSSEIFLGSIFTVRRDSVFSQLMLPKTHRPRFRGVPISGRKRSTTSFGVPGLPHFFSADREKWDPPVWTLFLTCRVKRDPSEWICKVPLEGIPGLPF